MNVRDDLEEIISCVRCKIKKHAHTLSLRDISKARAPCDAQAKRAPASPTMDRRRGENMFVCDLRSERGASWTDIHLTPAL